MTGRLEGARFGIHCHARAGGIVRSTFGIFGGDIAAEGQVNIGGGRQEAKSAMRVFRPRCAVYQVFLRHRT